jgi:hypothetical protein
MVEWQAYRIVKSEREEAARKKWVAENNIKRR